MGFFEDGGYRDGIFVDADGAVVGFYAAGEGGGAGCRIGDQAVGRVGFMKADDREFFQVEFVAVDVQAG